MAYSCYVRAEGRDLIDVEPTVTIRFDQLTAITRNRVRRVFEDNYCPYGWSSKPHIILVAMQGHYEVCQSLLSPKIMNHPDFDKDTFAAKALLLDYQFTILEYSNPKIYRHGYGDLLYKPGPRPGVTRDERAESARKQMDRLTYDTLLPLARSFIDRKKLAPILDALNNCQPYSFTGVNMR